MIGYVRVENFRSIRGAEISEIGDYAPIIGLNSSGKSNVLRALNLFFNNYLDENNTPLSMADDFSSYAPKRKKKIVSVTIAADVPLPAQRIHTHHPVVPSTRPLPFCSIRDASERRWD